MERSIIAVLVKGSGGEVADYVGSCAFNDEAREGDYFVMPMGAYDPQRTTRQRVIEWCNEARDAILPHCVALYSNATDNQPASAALFGGNLKRLRELKQRYDPTNFFFNTPTSHRRNDESRHPNTQPRD